jgi:hypothetical protein
MTKKNVTEVNYIDDHRIAALEEKVRALEGLVNTLIANQESVAQDVSRLKTDHTPIGGAIFQEKPAEQRKVIRSFGTQDLP